MFRERRVRTPGPLCTVRLLQAPAASRRLGGLGVKSSPWGTGTITGPDEQVQLRSQSCAACLLAGMVVIALALAGCASERRDTATATAPGAQVLALGDSNTSGGYAGIAWSVWPEILRARGLPVTNDAVGGTTSYDLLNTLETTVRRQHPSVVVVMTGTNDAWYGDPEGGFPRGDGADYSPRAFRARLREIVRRLRSLHGRDQDPPRVVLVTPPPAAGPGDGTHLWRDPDRLRAIWAATVAVARGAHASLVDVSSEIQRRPGWRRRYLHDGVHLTGAGQQLLADLIGSAVTAELRAKRA